MRSTTFLAILLAIVVGLSTTLMASDSDGLHSAEPSPGAREELKAYPKAKNNQVRYVIWLPHRERGEDNNWQVELITGKTIMGDNVNRMRLGGGELTSKIVSGWGLFLL